MTSQAKLSIRPLPHLEFVLGYPGIPSSTSASRNAAHIAGSIEVRLGSKGLKAQWLRIELRKMESVTGGENWGELIGKGPIDVWTALPGAGKGDREMDEDGSQWELLNTADFPFRIAIPDGLPPTSKLDKQSGISYEIVSSLCVKMAKGLFRKDTTTSVIQAVHPIVIEKHEMHSTWPIYNQPDLHSGERGLLRAKVRRDRTCFAPGDKIKVKVIVSSNRVEPAKIKSVAFSIKETVTFHGVKSSRMSLTSNGANAQKPASQHVQSVTQKAKQIGKKMYKGDSMNFDLECTIPKSHSLMSISTAKHVEVSYTMRVYVDISKAPIVIDHIPMLMTTFPRAHSEGIIRKIGFVEGLSERELTIEDDDGVSPQVMSRTSTFPSPSRRASEGGSSTSGRNGYSGYRNNYDGLQRSGTLMTNYSGPGMAGRGVPGQIFQYGSYDAVPAMFDPMVEAPRPAFAGPTSVYEAEGALSQTERAALSHYHTATPHGAPVGLDYTTIAATSGLGTPPAVTRSHFDSIPEEARPEVERHMQYHRNQSNPTRNLTPQQQGSQQQQKEAEEEKERLYQRARQQAERNQRKADERRALVNRQGSRVVSAGAYSLPPSVNSSRTGTPIARPSSATVLTNAEEEKRRLYERARREAETYQRGYAQGATFPQEQEEERSVTPQQHRHTSAPADTRPRLSVQPDAQLEAQRRSSGMYWLDSPTVDADEARGIHAHAPPVAAAPAPVAAPVAATSSSALSLPAPPGAFPSAEEEKRRLYDEAKAQTQSHIQQQQHHNLASSQPSASTNPSSTVATSTPPLSEKAQMARFHAAQDAVQQHQRQESTSNGAQQQQRPQSSYTAALPPLVTTPGPPRPAVSEKEQTRLYYEAMDRQASAADTPAASSSAPSYRHSIGPSPTVASPRPTYAPNYQNGALSWQQSRPTPLPPGPLTSAPGPATSGTGEVRSVSHTLPNSPGNHTASPSLPSLGMLSLGNDNSVWRGGTPVPTEGPWAPKVASSLWDSTTDEASSSAPPPLPPKTPLFTRP